MSATFRYAEDDLAHKYVLTIEEIAKLTKEGGKPAETLMNVVALIAGRFETDVCSAYLLEPDRNNLVLAATVGLRPECIGTLRLALHEGLTGLVAEEVRPVAVEQVATHPRFKFFGEAGEEAYQSFLGVPVIDRGVLQGVDVGLNNPRRPLEASGTSGQKVVLNGGLNLSVLDGWWAEAYDGMNGFAIGTGRTHSNLDVHDRRDGDDLYRVLRDEVIPLYYQRDRDGLPHGWIKRMKRTIRTLGWRFNADRMVMDYTLKCYVPAAGGTSSDMSRSR